MQVSLRTDANVAPRYYKRRFNPALLGTDGDVNLVGVSADGAVGTFGITASVTLTGVSATGAVGVFTADTGTSGSGTSSISGSKISGSKISGSKISGSPISRSYPPTNNLG